MRCHRTIAGLALAAVALAAVPVRSADLPAAAPVIPPLIILAPAEVRVDPTLARGCWLRLFPEPGYKGSDDLTIAGPIAIASLHEPTSGANGVYWKHKTESLIAGPRAKVTLYENEFFRGPSVAVQPGTQEPQLRGGLKFRQSIDSVKVECAG